MKKIIAIVLLALLVLVKAQSQTRSAWRVLHMTNTSTTIPSNLVSGLVIGGATNLYATRVTVLGKASPRSTNASVVYIGPSAADGTQPYPVNPGGEIVLRAPDTAPFNLRDWYVDVLNTSGDGVTIIFQ